MATKTIAIVTSVFEIFAKKSGSKNKQSINFDDLDSVINSIS